MNDSHMPELKIGDSTAKLPIIQGGMSVGISLSGLASAVANEGGIGVIGTAGIGMFEDDLYTNFVESQNRALRQEIRKARGLTNGLLGVNILVAMSNFADIASTAIDEGGDFIIAGAGLPLRLPGLLSGSKKTKLIPIVSSGRAAGIMCRRWIEKYDHVPDAFVVEGPLAGGHLGFKPEHIFDPDYRLEKLVPEVLAEISPFEEACGRKIPVIAAGGIYTGEDIYKFIRMGAAGVQMSTRFVGTYECDASERFKQTYLDAKKEDVVIISSPVGLPGRAIRNGFIDAVNEGKKHPFKCPFHCIITCKGQQSPYCIAFALGHAKRGNMDKGYAFCGANAYRVKELVHVKDLIHTLVEGYETAASRSAVDVSA